MARVAPVHVGAPVRPPAQATEEAIAPELTQAELEATFRARQEGGAWAAEQKKGVIDGVAKALGDTGAVKDVDCRDGACRVTVTHRDSTGQARLMSSLSTHPLRGFAAVHVLDEGGATVVYLEREISTDADEPESLTDVSNKFAAQSRDAAWADRMTQEIRSTLGPVLSGGTALDDLECQSTLCKLTLSHTSEAARQTFFSVLSENPIRAGEGAQLFTVEDHGSPKTVLFVSRQSTALAEGG